MRKISSTLLVTGFLWLASSSQGATVLKMNVDDLTRRSDVALVGKVRSISHQNQGNYPETLFRVEVLETFYGDGKMKEVTLCLPGGPAGNGLTTFVPGMPKFKVGEKVVLFLVLDRERGVAVPTGLEQGVFRVRVHPDSKQEYLVNRTVDLKLSSLGAAEDGKRAKAKRPLLSEFAEVVREKAKKLKKKE